MVQDTNILKWILGNQKLQRQIRCLEKSYKKDGKWCDNRGQDTGVLLQSLKEQTGLLVLPLPPPSEVQKLASHSWLSSRILRNLTRITGVGTSCLIICSVFSAI